MSDRRTTTEQKLGTLVRLLASEHDGEALAAARSIVRVLKATGADIHTLAERVENVNGGKLSEAESKKLYRAGFEAGMRAAEDKFHGDVEFCDVNGTPSWHSMATWCQRRGGRLRDREREFVDQMAERTCWRSPTQRQGRWLKSIWHRLGGGREF